MRSPVHFQSLARELKPVSPYLSGRVLNAGCGDRDITQLLKSWRASHVDNCDVRSSIPGAVLCDLTDIPKPDASYDAILCNAVLEHVADPERVMGEFHRLLAPDGNLVVSVPFLQPFHASPLDFRRYTRLGLKQLGERTGFQVQYMWGVHSLAQTIGWLLWAHLEERGYLFGKLLCWLPIYLASRFVQGSPNGMYETANSFQAVMVKQGS